MKKIVNSTKNYVRRNKSRLTWITICTLGAAVTIQHTGIKSLNEFLKENNLFEAYYGFPPK